MTFCLPSLDVSFRIALTLSLPFPDMELLIWGSLIFSLVDAELGKSENEPKSQGALGTLYLFAGHWGELGPLSLSPLLRAGLGRGLARPV